MHHLSGAVPEVDPARDVAVAADGQHLVDAPARHAEEDEADVAGPVLDQHSEGALAQHRRPVRHHGDAEGHGFARRRVADRAAERPGNAALGQVEQQVGDAGRPLLGAQQLLDQRRDLRSDAGQAAGGGEERIEDAGA
ncbi:hypothetical protein GCM10025880_17490 [Methylorubrum aminovorans]|nr:hypothetical protein GCM10025880_17490 [Methylorubrum aminovorans]